MKLIFLAFCVLLPYCLSARTVTDSVRNEQLDGLRSIFDSLGKVDPAYLQETDLSVGNIKLSELLRSIATVNRINLCVKATQDPLVACNFNRARITDLLYFLCREYGLEADVCGNIVTLSSPVLTESLPPEPFVSYDSVRALLSFDFREAALADIGRRVTRLTGTNVIVPQSIYTFRVSSYLENLPLPEALEALASANGLVINKGEGGVWGFEMPGGHETTAATLGTGFRRRSFPADHLSVDSLRRVSAHITSGKLEDILAETCELLGEDYFFAAPVKGQTSIYVKDIDSRTFFDVILGGTGVSCGEYDGVFVFGDKGKEGAMVTTRVMPLRFRAAAALPELIPEALKKEVQVQLFPDLNSLIVSGESRKVSAICRFLETVDKRIPLITIDVIIADVTKSTIREAGIEAGLGNAPSATSGTLSAGIDMKLNAASINKLINSFNGFGSINLGRVTPDFYMNLKFLEEAGDIELRSTPKLSTLNGHEATLKSGETRHYKEVASNIIGTQNPIQSDSYTWKSIDANLSLRIVPYVGQDNNITLEVEIEQSEFTGKEEKDAPPTTATRSFKSLIRVKDGEMVLLGGIERNSRERTSRGLPFISRIPVLKWLFGSTKNNKVSQKLNIFIKPTVL